MVNTKAVYRDLIPCLFLTLFLKFVVLFSHFSFESAVIVIIGYLVRRICNGYWSSEQEPEHKFEVQVQSLIFRALYADAEASAAQKEKADELEQKCHELGESAKKPIEEKAKLSDANTELKDGKESLRRQLVSIGEEKDAAIDELQNQNQTPAQELVMARAAFDEFLQQRRIETEAHLWAGLEQLEHTSQSESQTLRDGVVDGSGSAKFEPLIHIEEPEPFKTKVQHSSDDVDQAAPSEHLEQQSLLLAEGVENDIPGALADYLAAGHEGAEYLGKGTFRVIRTWKNPRRCQAVKSEVYAATMLNLAGTERGSDDDDGWGVLLPQELMRYEVGLLLGELKDEKHILKCSLAYFDNDAVNGMMLLELMDGTVQDLVKRGLTGSREGLTFLDHCCQRLRAMANANIGHFDLKPSNIGYKKLTDGNYHFAFMDFGISRRIEEVDPARQAVGTPAYIAPEIMESGYFSTQADIYSLFACLVFLYDFGGVKLQLCVMQQRGKLDDGLERDAQRLIREAIGRDERTWDWPDMSDEDPEWRPSAEDLMGRVWLVRMAASARLAMKMGLTEQGHSEPGALWVKDRKGRKKVLVSQLRKQGRTDGEMRVLLDRHQILFTEPVKIFT